MKIRGAIFDLDGTLLDSMFIWRNIGADYLISRGIEPETKLNEKLKKMSLVEAAEYYQRVYGLTDSVEDIIDGVKRMIVHLYADVVKPKLGVPALLQVMQEKDIKMCIATATDRFMFEAALKNNGISAYFSDILTCSEVGAGKESPEIFERALMALGTSKADTLVFEDSLHAIRTAKNAGFRVAAVYDASASGDRPAIEALCDEYISSYEAWSAMKL